MKPEHLPDGDKVYVEQQVDEGQVDKNLLHLFFFYEYGDFCDERVWYKIE